MKKIKYKDYVELYNFKIFFHLRTSYGNHNSLDGWVGLALYELASLFGWEGLVQMQPERSKADKWGN